MTFLDSFILTLSYLIGTIPSGILIARARGIDITREGSGNIGATNVARVVGKRAGAYTLLGDVCKGVLAVLLARILGESTWIVPAAAVTVIAGHCFSLPPMLKGGKGIATALGTNASLHFFAAMSGLAVFIVLAYLTRIISFASLAAAATIPLVAFVSGAPDSVSLPLAIISGIVALRHRENIERLIAGSEPKFSFGKKDS